jgi:hypothetical protein
MKLRWGIWNRYAEQFWVHRDGLIEWYDTMEEAEAARAKGCAEYFAENGTEISAEEAEVQPLTPGYLAHHRAAC